MQIIYVTSLLFRKYKELLQLSNEQLIQKWAKDLNIHFCKEDIPISTWKNAQLPLSFRKMKIKTTRRHHFTFIRLAIIKKTKTGNKCWWGCEEIGTPSIAGRNIKRCSHFRKHFGISSKVKHRVTVWPSNSTHKYTARRNENICPHKTLCVNVYSNMSR